jgi:vitamin B12 transporter
LKTVAASAAILAAFSATALAQQPVQLEGILIEGGSTLLEPVDANSIGSATTVITGEELRQRQITNVADALRMVPGVSVSRSGSVGGLTAVRIRGAEDNQALVLIDGIKANDTTNGVFDFASLLADDIERIEVIRGPQSGIWGSNAMSGVINIVTKSGENQPLTATASAEGGAFNSRQLSASIRGGNEFAHAAVSIVDAKTHGFNISPLGDEADGSERRNIRARGGFKVTPWLSFEGVLNKLDNKTDIDSFSGFKDGFTVAGDQPDSTSTTDALLTKGTARLSFLDDRWITKIYGDYTRNDVESIEPFFNSLNESEREKYGVVSSYTFEQNQLGGLKHTIVGLYEDETSSFKTSSIPGVSFERTVKSVAGEYRGEYFKQLFFRAAVRNDDSEEFGDFTTYSLSGAWKVPTTNTRFHASYGTGVVLPEMFQQFGSFPEFIPNAGLKAETSKGYDVGIEQAFWQRRAIVDVTYFNQNLEDEIDVVYSFRPDPTTGAFGFFGEPINLAEESKRQGIEVSARVTPIDGLTISGSYTYLDATGGDGFAEVRRPEHSGSVNVAYAFAQGRGLVNLGVVYNGDMTDYAFDANFLRNTVTLQEYTLVNLSAHYDVTENIRLFGRVENLLDEDYQEVFGYETAPVAAYGGVRIKLGGTRETAALE